MSQLGAASECATVETLVESSTFDADFILQLLRDSRITSSTSCVSGDKGSLECAEMVLKLLVDLFRFEHVLVVNSFMKCDLFSALADCNSHLLQTLSFAKLLTNLLSLNKPELQGVRLDCLLQICNANLTDVIAVNFLESNQVIFVQEGAMFFAQLVGVLQNFSTVDSRSAQVEEQLLKLVVSDGLLERLGSCVLNFKERDVDALTLTVTAFAIHTVLKLAQQFDQKAIFAVFERSGCLDAVEALQENANRDVYDASVELIKWYDEQAPDYEP